MNEKKLKLEESKIKSLIIEDDKASLMLLKLLLRKYCHKILESKNGIDAVNICKREDDIDLILMDLQMEGITGLEAARRIRSFNRNVVIVAQSAYTINEVREKALAAGCDDFITKPIQKKELLSILSKRFTKLKLLVGGCYSM